MLIVGNKMAVSGDVTVARDGGHGNAKLHPYVIALVRWCVSCVWGTATVLLHRLMMAPLQPIMGSKPASKSRAAGKEHLHPEPKVECVVLHEPASADLDVIFVHGLYGSLGNTWRQGDWRSKYKKEPNKIPLRRSASIPTPCSSRCDSDQIDRQNKSDNEYNDLYNDYEVEVELNEREDAEFTNIDETFYEDIKKLLPTEDVFVTEKFYNNTLLNQVEIIDNCDTHAKFVRDLFKCDNENCDSNECDSNNDNSEQKLNKICVNEGNSNIKINKIKCKCEVKINEEDLKCNIDKIKCTCTGDVTINSNEGKINEGEHDKDDINANNSKSSCEVKIKCVCNVNVKINDEEKVNEGKGDINEDSSKCSNENKMNNIKCTCYISGKVNGDNSGEGKINKVKSELKEPEYKINKNCECDVEIKLNEVKIKDKLINDGNETKANEVTCKCNNSEAKGNEMDCKCKKKCEVGCGCVCDECYSTCWPRDWIRIDYPNARVISINYTSDPHLWRPLWVKENKRLRLHERAEQMTKQLLELGVGQRPIIWVGHSKGGLFIKQIYCEAYEAYLKIKDNIVNSQNLEHNAEEQNCSEYKKDNETNHLNDTDNVTDENAVIDTVVSEKSVHSDRNNNTSDNVTVLKNTNHEISNNDIEGEAKIASENTIHNDRSNTTTDDVLFVLESINVKSIKNIDNINDSNDSSNKVEPIATENINQNNEIMYTSEITKYDAIAAVEIDDVSENNLETKNIKEGAEIDEVLESKEDNKRDIISPEFTSIKDDTKSVTTNDLVDTEIIDHIQGKSELHNDIDNTVMSSKDEEDMAEYRTRANLWSESAGFMFYSVPHRGSPLAAIKTPITARSIELLEISKDCALVMSLHDRWMQATAPSRPLVRSLVETCRTLMSVLWLRIVSVESADAGIGALCGVSVDHREICKPTSRQCMLYTELTNLIHVALNKCKCQ